MPRPSKKATPEKPGIKVEDKASANEQTASLEKTIEVLRKEIDLLRNSTDPSKTANAGSQSTLRIYPELDFSGLLSERDIVEALHNWYAQRFAVRASSVFYRKKDGVLIRTPEFFTPESLTEIVDRLDEEGIIDWALEDLSVKIVPNLLDFSNANSSIIIAPLVLREELVAVSIASSDKSPFNIPEEDKKLIAEVMASASIYLDSIINKSEKIKLAKAVSTLNNQILHKTLIASAADIAVSIARESENPLKVAITNINLIESGVGNPEKRIELIKKQLITLIELNEKALALTKFDEEIALLNVCEIIDELINITEFQFKASGIKFDKFFESETILVRANKAQLQSVFLSIISNSRDTMPDGGTVTVGVYMFGAKKFSINIVDDGDGILEQDLNNIFEPDYSPGEIGKTASQSLYLAKTIIEGFKGKISVYSERDKGATYKIVLPIAKK